MNEERKKEAAEWGKGAKAGDAQRDGVLRSIITAMPQAEAFVAEDSEAPLRPAEEVRMTHNGRVGVHLHCRLSCTRSSEESGFDDGDAAIQRQDSAPEIYYHRWVGLHGPAGDRISNSETEPGGDVTLIDVPCRDAGR